MRETEVGRQGRWEPGQEALAAATPDEEEPDDEEPDDEDPDDECEEESDLVSDFFSEFEPLDTLELDRLSVR